MKIGQKRARDSVVIGATLFLIVGLALATAVFLAFSFRSGTPIEVRFPAYVAVSTQVGLLVATMAYFAATYYLLVATRKATIVSNMTAYRLQADAMTPALVVESCDLSVMVSSLHRESMVINEIDSARDPGGRLLVNQAQAIVEDSDLCVRTKLRATFAGKADRGCEVYGSVNLDGVDLKFASQQFLLNEQTQLVEWESFASVNAEWSRKALADGVQMSATLRVSGLDNAATDRFDCERPIELNSTTSVGNSLVRGLREYSQIELRHPVGWRSETADG